MTSKTRKPRAARRRAGAGRDEPKVTQVSDLIHAAISAARHSYSPYSRFPVGAAVLTADGTVISGCNVENASFGLTVCAERVALASAVAAGHRVFKALAVAGGSGPRGARPCGACLQALAEFCREALPVFLTPLAPAPRNRDRVIECLLLRDLLPHGFVFP
jgi:cytidine deaminase